MKYQSSENWSLVWDLAKISYAATSPLSQEKV
jgi:hypothetical protein